MSYDLLGTFCVDEEVFLLLCMEGSFVLLPTGGMATVVDIRSHLTTRHPSTVADETCLQHGGKVAAWNVALSQIMKVIAVK